MKRRIKFLLIPVIVVSTMLAANAQPTAPTYSTYGGQKELFGQQSVRLLPGFHAQAGSGQTIPFVRHRYYR